MIRRRGSNQLRGVNVNAPLAGGLRPDPTSARSPRSSPSPRTQFDAISVNLNYARLQQRLFISANYFFGRSIDETDSPFGLPADNYNLAAERGPASGFARHRFMSLANLPLTNRLRLGTSLRLQSGTPYNITTGRDDNGDTVSNDRPAGVTRNTGLGTAQVDLGLRLSWGLAFGPRRRLRPGRRCAWSAATAPIHLAPWPASTAAASATPSSSTRRRTTR